MDWSTVIVGFVSAAFAFLGVYISNRKQAALMDYRLGQLEKKVDLHNKVIDRTYKLEARADVLETEVDEMKKRVG